jgi:hypothetical protein
MQNRLLVFKPFVLAHRGSLSLADPSRTHAVDLKAEAFSETVRVTLAPGFAVDELPEPINLDTAFGSYATDVRHGVGELVVTRRLIVKRASVAVDQYAAVRGFFERARTAELAAVVLVRRPQRSQTPSLS